VAADPLDDLATRLGSRCLALGLRVATVESCTGGLVGDRITQVPGSSAYYVGGFVTYSDDLKRNVVGVPHDTLAAHGAVSVTGIAGPDGGSPAKPVGLTYVAVADAVGVAVRRYIWPGDRTDNKRRSAAAALELLLERAEASAEAAVGGPSAGEPISAATDPA
jgi:nicotinamide-nucleotide amidase